MRLHILLPAATLSLAACTALPPGACDPADRDASIIRKMQCDGSGSYRQTIDRKESALATAQEENALFRQSLEALEAQRASFGQSLAAQQKARDAAVASTRKLLDQIKAKGATSDKLRVQLHLAEKDLASLQAQPIDVDASDAAIAARQRKVQELQQMVRRLRASVLQTP